LEEAVKEAAYLQKLHGVGVISDGLLQCLNGGLDDWSYCLTNRSATSAVVSAGNSPAGSAAAQAAGDSAEASPLYSSLEQAQYVLLQLLNDGYCVSMSIRPSLGCSRSSRMWNACCSWTSWVL
jgi:hypothetical protein